MREEYMYSRFEVNYCVGLLDEIQVASVSISADFEKKKPIIQQTLWPKL